MTQDYDVIIAGLGAMGSATVRHLAAAGCKVLGLDRFRPPHDRGSSHGRTRIIREAYFEHPLYVPLVQRAYELWFELERETKQRLLLPTGGLMLGPPEGVLVEGSRRSAREHRLRHEILGAEEVHKRFPALQPEERMVGVWEPRAGVLFPETAIQLQLDLAATAGATLRFDEPILGWEAEKHRVRVATTNGDYTARRLMLSVGAWTADLLGELKLPLAVERQITFWFEPRAAKEQFAPGACPIHIWEYAVGRFFYGFPDLGDGVKVAFHHQGEVAQADRVDREVTLDDIKTVRGLVRRFLPDADGKLAATTVCLYTNTPDENFLVDFHPAHRNVLIASPCSGHGFKFSPVIGEICAALLKGEEPGFDLSPFRLGRFG